MAEKRVNPLDRARLALVESQRQPSRPPTSEDRHVASARALDHATDLPATRMEHTGGGCPAKINHRRPRLTEAGPRPPNNRETR